MEKEQAQFDRLVQQGILYSGKPLSSVLILKGELTDADRSDQGLLSGADGDALTKSLAALNYENADWLALSTIDKLGKTVSFQVLREAILGIGAQTIIVCDDTAKDTLSDAFAAELAEIPVLEDALLTTGSVVHLLGMRVLSLGGFEKSLASTEEKYRMWGYLQKIPPLKSVLT